MRNRISLHGMIVLGMWAISLMVMWALLVDVEEPDSDIGIAEAPEVEEHGRFRVDTIRVKLDPNQFTLHVNAAVADGWTLRQIAGCGGYSGSVIFFWERQEATEIRPASATATLWESE